MSALASLLANRGYSISGSDQKQPSNIEKLISEGIEVFTSQVPENIKKIYSKFSLPPIIVVSTAIPKNNPELNAAQECNLKIIHRSDILADLIEKQSSIAVAGTHGKTTTSTFLTTLLAAANQDPSAVIGGLVPYYQSNSHAGKGKLLIAEADESDGSLIKFKPRIGIITNLELDHADYYQDIKELIKTMQLFANSCNFVLANYDCMTLRKHFKPEAWWSISTKEYVDFAALPLEIDGNLSTANIYEKSKLIGEVTIPLPGIHNLSNAIAAIAACRINGIPFNTIKECLPFIKAPSRRFEFRGAWRGRQVVDDYAHHPSEIKATIKTAKLMINSGKSTLPKAPQRLISVFQPHRYSRTKEFLNEYAVSFKDSDLILLAPIYSAGEAPINGVSSEALAKAIRKHLPNHPVYVANSLDDLTILIKKYTYKDDLILMMGAGDINNSWEKLNADELYLRNLAA